MPQALLILTILVAVLAYALYPYINAFFGAFILYVIFKPLYAYMINRLKVNQSIAALSIILLTIIIIIIPLYILITIIIFQIQSLLFDTGSIMQYLDAATVYISQLPLDTIPVEINIREKVAEIIETAANFFSVMLINAIQSIGQRMIEFIIMYFLLYYLLVEVGTDSSEKLKRIIPFSSKNRDILQAEFKSIVNATLVSSGIIALVQGSLLTITFLLLGVEGAFLWGFVAVILSFLPVVGATLIWIPATIIQLIQHDYFTAGGILVGGIILSSIDNFLRPAIQKKVGSIHPLSSLIGVIFGLNLFGLLGIVIGPLLISYVVLMAKMFNDEYLAEAEVDSN